MNFAANLRTALRARGWSPASLERASFIHRNQIQAYLSGSRLPSLENAKKIAEALSVSLDLLCGIEQQ